MADSTCSAHGWSILNSAPTNSALAGVLAGFAFTAGVIYIGRYTDRGGDSDSNPQTAARHSAARSLQDVQTISLFTRLIRGPRFEQLRVGHRRRPSTVV